MRKMVFYQRHISISHFFRLLPVCLLSPQFFHTFIPSSSLVSPCITPLLHPCFCAFFNHLSASTSQLLCCLKVKKTSRGCFQLSFSVPSLYSLSVSPFHPHCCPHSAASFKVLTLGREMEAVFVTIPCVCMESQAKYTTYTASLASIHGARPCLTYCML